MKAKAISGPLNQELLNSIKNENLLGVYYLTEPINVPYAYTPDVDTQTVEVFEQSATRVGVKAMATGSVTVLLVSDSFRPCVPVIAIGQEKNSLVHFQGA